MKQTPLFNLFYFTIIIIRNLQRCETLEIFCALLGDTKDIIDKYCIQKIGFLAMKWRKITLITYVRRIQIVPIG